MYDSEDPRLTPQYEEDKVRLGFAPLGAGDLFNTPSHKAQAPESLRRVTGRLDQRAGGFRISASNDVSIRDCRN